MIKQISDRIRHFFHVVSNVRPVAWIGLYVLLVPIFAVIYNLLPDGQFRIPDGGTTDFGSWLYYSIVTITTLGFGDYTPTHGLAQAVTAVEVMCGLVFLGFFLNAVGSMKSEIDVESEIEKQRRLHEAQQRERLVGMIPPVLTLLNRFLDLCNKEDSNPTDSNRHALLRSAARVSLSLDSIQNRVDLTQWPELLEGCFTFVADYQLYISAETPDDEVKPDTKELVDGLSKLAMKIETELTAIISAKPDSNGQ